MKTTSNKNPRPTHNAKPASMPLSLRFVFLGKRNLGKRNLGKHNSGKTNWGSRACALFLLCVATAIASPAQTFTTQYKFGGTDGSTPSAGLVQGTDGYLYGTTSAQGPDKEGTAFQGGTIFKFLPGGTLITLYNFCSLSSCADGSNPSAVLVQGENGDFYGTTYGGGNPACGTYGCGTVFEVTPAGDLTTLHTFCTPSSCPDGANPSAGLVLGKDGNFYGTTSSFGANLEGTVFKITPAGAFTTLHTFDGTDGDSPVGLLIQGAVDGYFYGTTYSGGANGSGTVFRITPAGKLTTLHSFDGTDGANPYAGLVQLLNPLAQNFYGTTYSGGANGDGTVFEITPAGKLTTLYSFCALSKCADGANPHAGLIEGQDGNFWGTTIYGGANDSGTIFKVSLHGALATEHSFCMEVVCADGDSPTAALAAYTNGTFYGTTSGGGGGNGTVFSLSIPGFGGLVLTEPTSGKVGTAVKILGTNLTGTPKVNFGGTPSVFKVVSDYLITATVPEGAESGIVYVFAGSGFWENSFFVTPQIKSFAPVDGSAGTSVVITGVSLTQTTKVTFGGAAATTFTVDSDTQVTATVPTDALTGRVAITTEGGIATNATSFTVTP
jgi:uncharacterized repeat protein (TIGR03803 family)